MKDDSRKTFALVVPTHVRREFKKGVVALAVACAVVGMGAPAAMAKTKEAPSKVSKSKVKASSSDAGKATAKASKAKPEAKARVAAAKPERAARATSGKRTASVSMQAKGGKAAARTGGKAAARAVAVAATSSQVALASKNRKVVSHDRIQAVALAKGAAALGTGAALSSGARVSYAERAGLDHGMDALGLKASVAYVVDQDTQEVLLNKNADAVLPIASITKLMTALVVSESRLPLDEMLTINEADIDTVKGTSSRLSMGTQLSRGEMLHLALMSSENRAANALGRYYPGGLSAFVRAMNAKAAALGMNNTRYVEPTGLSSRNQSSAKDLARLLDVAEKDPLLSSLSTDPNLEVEVGSHFQRFNNTNRLIHDARWGIGVQKTGYISEAGQCLVLQSQIQGRKVLMVFLDSETRNSRIDDAQRVRDWLNVRQASSAPDALAAPVATVFQAADVAVEEADD